MNPRITILMLIIWLGLLAMLIFDRIFQPGSTEKQGK